MAFKKGQSGNSKGRPKGTITKPKLADHLTDEQISNLVKKAYSMAELGNETMLRFILEQKFGKAIQPTDMNIVGDMYITFDDAFKNK